MSGPAVVVGAATSGVIPVTSTVIHMPVLFGSGHVDTCKARLAGGGCGSFHRPKLRLFPGGVLLLKPVLTPARLPLHPPDDHAAEAQHGNEHAAYADQNPVRQFADAA